VRLSLRSLEHEQGSSRMRKAEVSVVVSTPILVLAKDINEEPVTADGKGLSIPQQHLSLVRWVRSLVIQSAKMATETVKGRR
jgi:hypothetical protein